MHCNNNINNHQGSATKQPTAQRNISDLLQEAADLRKKVFGESNNSYSGSMSTDQQQQTKIGSLSAGSIQA